MVRDKIFEGGGGKLYNHFTFVTLCSSERGGEVRKECIFEIKMGRIDASQNLSLIAL